MLLEGDDTKCTVTIIDEDLPGTIGFEKTDVRVSNDSTHATVKITRTDGIDGTVTCDIRTEAFTAHVDEHFVPLAEGFQVKFEHGECEKEVKIQLAKVEAPDPNKKEESGDDNKNDDEESDAEEVIFKVFVENVEPKGAKFNAKNFCSVNIVSGEVDDAEMAVNNKLLEFYLNQKERTYE